MKVKYSLSSLTNGLVAESVVDGQTCHLLMPLTYMNHSGTAVQQMLEKKKIELPDLLIIADDFNLPFGQIRLRPKGTDGGHHGLSSVIEQLKTDSFSRLRMGIGRLKQAGDATDYVLGEFAKTERAQLSQFLDRAAAGSLIWFKEGINKAMEQFNTRKKNG